jgi:hypothetical protein
MRCGGGALFYILMCDSRQLIKLMRKWALCHVNVIMNH